jgi:hypothetical protein
MGLAFTEYTEWGEMLKDLPSGPSSSLVDSSIDRGGRAGMELVGGIDNQRWI